MITKNLDFSVITVTRNAEKYIEKNLRSVANQTYENIEHLIIDGASIDKTVNIVEQHSKNNPNLKFISEPDFGIYDAMNKGIRMAQGDILFFLNADDFFPDNNLIEGINAIFHHDQKLMVVFGDITWVNENKIFSVKQPKLVTREFLGRKTILHQSIFARKEVFQITGEFSTRYKIVSDYEWMLKVFLRHNFHYQYVPRLITEVLATGVSNTTNWEHERILAMMPFYSINEIFKYRIFPKLNDSVKKYAKKIYRKFR